MEQEWDKLTLEERAAFYEWDAARKNPPQPKYADMTAAQRQEFHRRTGTPQPYRGTGR